MNSDNFFVDVHLHDGARSVKAHADLRIELPDGPLTIFGFPVIEKNGQAPWVSFPSKEGKTPGRYFPLCAAEGQLRKRICEIVLEAYLKAKAG